VTAQWPTPDWDLRRGVPPHARNELVAAGLNPDDPAAVIAFYESRGNGTDGAPYWLADYRALHP
jgi:hypothetical protein